MENTSTNNIERLYDVEMNVTVRFGTAEIPLREVVRFGIGTMVELDRTIDDPVELLVNNYPFAKGEVVVIDGYYGVRVTEIGSPEERSQKLLSSPVANQAASPIASPIANPAPTQVPAVTPTPTATSPETQQQTQAVNPNPTAAPATPALPTAAPNQEAPKP